MKRRTKRNYRIKEEGKEEKERVKMREKQDIG